MGVVLNINVVPKLRVVTTCALIGTVAYLLPYPRTTNTDINCTMVIVCTALSTISHAATTAAVQER